VFQKKIASKEAKNRFSLVLLISLLLLSGCTASTQNTTPTTSDTSQTTPEVTDKQIVSIPESHPKFILDMITEFSKKSPQQQPESITRYIYKGQPVYYINPPCCDFFSKLYDVEGNLLGAPDGGITGRGDGTLKDFHKLRTDAYGIWKKKQ